MTLSSCFLFSSAIAFLTIPTTFAASLYYFAETDAGCRFKRWKPKTRKMQRLAMVNECPDNIFYSPRAKKWLAVIDNGIFEITFKPTVEIRGPVPMIRRGSTSIKNMMLYRLGFLKKGTLAATYIREVGTTSGYRCSLHTFAHIKGRWKPVQKGRCKRKGISFNAPGGVSGLGWSELAMYRSLWNPHPKVRGMRRPPINNFLFTTGTAKREGSGFDFDPQGKTRVEGWAYKDFQFGQERTVLYYDVKFTDRPLVGGISVHLNRSKLPKAIRSGGQYETRLFDRYVLIYDLITGSNAEVLDLFTGTIALRETMKFPMIVE